VFLRWLYSTNFGLALNGIRDDEEKAEAMGIRPIIGIFLPRIVASSALSAGSVLSG